MGVNTLDYSWAEHLLTKYEEEHNLKLNESDNISCILEALMDENNFECCEKDFEDIVDMLIRNFL
jgi:hypothetical protein